MNARAKDLARDYAHHPPSTPDEGQAHAVVRERFAELARFIEDNVPQGRERSIVHTKLEEAMMWSNAAIARARFDG